MKVQDLMTHEVLTCSQADTLEQAARVMWESDVGCVVVTDGDRTPIGMITDRDIAMAAYTQGVALRAARVGSVMSRQVITCSPSASLRDIENVMQKSQIRRIPVVDAADGIKLVGIVTLADIARGARSPARALELPGLAKTLADICERRWNESVAAQ